MVIYRICQFLRMTQRSIHQEQMCRICLQTTNLNIISPCKCIGSTSYIHQQCFLAWVKYLRIQNSQKLTYISKSNSYSFQCELCKAPILFSLQFVTTYTCQLIKKIILSLILPIIIIGLWTGLCVLLVKQGQDESDYNLGVRLFALIILILVGLCCLTSIVIAIVKVIDEQLIRNSRIQDFKLYDQK